LHLTRDSSSRASFSNSDYERSVDGGHGRIETCRTRVSADGQSNSWALGIENSLHWPRSGRRTMTPQSQTSMVQMAHSARLRCGCLGVENVAGPQAEKGRSSASMLELRS
jgi:hypothetical protein